MIATQAFHLLSVVSVVRLFIKQNELFILWDVIIVSIYRGI